MTDQSNDLFNSENPFFVDPNKNYLEELVGENKKYKDPAQLAYSKVHADATIEKLKQEMESMRNELSSRLAMEEVLKKIEESSTQKQGSTEFQHQREQSGSEEQKANSQISQEEIKKLVQETLFATESAKKAQQNLEKFQKEVVDKWGEESAFKLKEEASQLGLTIDQIKKLASENPTATIRMLGIVNARTNNTFTPAPSGSSGFKSNGTQVGHSYYENLRKSNPAEYWTPKVQNEIFKLAQTNPNYFST